MKPYIEVISRQHAERLTNEDITENIVLTCVVIAWYLMHSMIFIKALKELHRKKKELEFFDDSNLSHTGKEFLN